MNEPNQAVEPRPYVGKNVCIRTPKEEVRGFLGAIDPSNGMFYIHERHSEGAIAICPFHWDSTFEIYEVTSSGR